MHKIGTIYLQDLAVRITEVQYSTFWYIGSPKYFRGINHAIRALTKLLTLI